MTVTKSAKKLTNQARENLDTSKFAIPEKRKYPIHDKNHARAALSMVAAHGSENEKQKVRQAVNNKYPDIGGE